MVGKSESPRTNLNSALPILDSSKPSEGSEQSLVVESAVFDRYAAAANQQEAALCCPVDYASIDMSHIPDEVIERDYGCGNPAPYVEEGDTVLDLGSGGGKICFAAAKMVGPTGRIIGVDCNVEMLSLARRNAPLVAERLGYENVEFHFGMIQDLKLDLEQAAEQFPDSPSFDAEQLMKLKRCEQDLRDNSPMIADNSIDCVVSNCVLNLVRREDRLHMFHEIFRVLKEGGRVAISDIVSDEDVPYELQNDSELWSGCISGAFREDKFIEAFEQAGFRRIEIAEYQTQPWQVVQGIEFRSMTLLAFKPPSDPCWDHMQAVMYRGPHARVTDENGNDYVRGARTAVCDRTYRELQASRLAEQFIFIEPENSVAPQDRLPFDCSGTRIRLPSEIKAVGPSAAEKGGSCCGPEPGCC